MRYWYSAVQYGTVQYSAVQCSVVQYSTVQYSASRRRTAQYSTVQYSAVQPASVSVSLFVCELSAMGNIMGWGPADRTPLSLPLALALSLSLSFCIWVSLSARLGSIFHDISHKKRGMWQLNEEG
jgi:hypothetical protein